MKQTRCINIDWLEVYCLESVTHFPCNADFWRSQGWFVRERDYGTRQYAEMFTLEDREGNPFIEIRRNPVASGAGEKNEGIFSPYSTHIRLVNRYCYHENAVGLLSEFLARYDYDIQRLYRLDLALDFEKFDKGDDPHKFLLRYMAGRFSKINQGNLSGHAKDLWERRDWNSVSWGSPKSMVSTKLYNKTLELREAKDKPYIRLAWMQAGLIDDALKMVKYNPDGTTYYPEIWRVEFSIKSSARGWYTYEDCNGAKQKRLVREHTLATYADRNSQLKAFAFLAHHYFHFKHYVDGERKDRCPDKVLFDFGLQHQVYQLDVLATDEPAPRSIDVLRRKLQEYRIQHPANDIVQACDVLLADLDKRSLASMLPYGAKDDAAKLLQLLLSRRIKQNPKEPMSESLAEVQAMMKIEQDSSLF